MEENSQGMNLHERSAPGNSDVRMSSSAPEPIVRMSNVSQSMHPSTGDDGDDGVPNSRQQKKASQHQHDASHHQGSQQHQGSPKQVLLVCHILPLHFTKVDNVWTVEWDTEEKSQLLHQLAVSSSSVSFHFIGCPHVFIPEDEEDDVELLVSSFQCTPVFLAKATAHEHYQGFCQGVLWPLFHNIVDVYNTASISIQEDKTKSSIQATLPERLVPGICLVPETTTFHGVESGIISQVPETTAATNEIPELCTLPDSSLRSFSQSNPHLLGHSHSTDTIISKNDINCSWQTPQSWNPLSQEDCWGSYCIVNRIFASKVVEKYHEEMVVWIHGYQLMMLPSYLIRKLRRANIAFFLHLPFPSSEIFRSLAMRTDILRALLCANHIGFILFEHARHFLTCCKRLLGVSYNSKQGGSLGIEYNGRNVMVTCSHMSINMEQVEKNIDYSPSMKVDSIFKEIEQYPTTNTPFIFASIDSMQGLSAIPLKLLAFDRFLSNSSVHGTVPILIQIGIR